MLVKKADAVFYFLFPVLADGAGGENKQQIIQSGYN